MAEASIPPLRVMSLHALMYCERLFYLEEVEEIRVADEAVFAGRALHEAIEDAGEGPVETQVLESERLGLRGKVDCIRMRDGAVIPYEHKRGRSHKGESGAEAWKTDRVQALAYGILVRECLEATVPEVRIRYHEDNTLIRLAMTEEAEGEVLSTIKRARELQASLKRPPVASNEHLCVRCSLAPVCLPEEERLAEDSGWDPIRLFPPDPDKVILHVLTPGAKVGRSGDSLTVAIPHEKVTDYGAETIASVVLHGNAQISTQALGMCAEKDIGVHWITGGGRYLGCFMPGAGGVQRRIRQFEALSDENRRLSLSKRLVSTKLSTQLRFLLRATRGRDREAFGLKQVVGTFKDLLQRIPTASDTETLRGFEGAGAHSYFGVLGGLLRPEVPEGLRPQGRSRRPPMDPFNALLSFCYAMLYKDVLAAILSVGLEPAFGFMHQPRSAAHPLALDLMELFRVPLVDMAVLASMNRLQWDEKRDFVRTGKKVWLSDFGRRMAIDLYERRKEEHWKHPVTGYSLSYARLLELEVRLLEKEWTGKAGLFARMSIR